MTHPLVIKNQLNLGEVKNTPSGSIKSLNSGFREFYEVMDYLSSAQATSYIPDAYRVILIRLLKEYKLLLGRGTLKKVCSNQFCEQIGGDKKSNKNISVKENWSKNQVMWKSMVVRNDDEAEDEMLQSKNKNKFKIKLKKIESKKSELPFQKQIKIAQVSHHQIIDRLKTDITTKNQQIVDLKDTINSLLSSVKKKDTSRNQGKYYWGFIVNQNSEKVKKQAKDMQRQQKMQLQYIVLAQRLQIQSLVSKVMQKQEKMRKKCGNNH